MNIIILMIAIVGQVLNHQYNKAWQKANQSLVKEVKSNYDQPVEVNFKYHIVLHNFFLFLFWIGIIILVSSFFY